MKSFARRSAVLAPAIAVPGGLAVSLSACSTTEGFGKDVRNTGTTIQKSAQDNK